VEQMSKELSDSVDGISVTFNNVDAHIIIPPAQENSMISIILKQIKKISK
jgi:hypothetical protein